MYNQAFCFPCSLKGHKSNKMVIVHKTELLILSSLFGCSQRNWLRHSADLQLCRMSCRHLWMPSGRAMLQGCAVTVKRCCLYPTKSATNIATSKTCSWPSASSTSASSSCRTTRLFVMVFEVCLLLWMLSWLPLGWIDLSAVFIFFLCWKGDTQISKLSICWWSAMLVFSAGFSFIILSFLCTLQHYMFSHIVFSTFSVSFQQSKVWIER